MPKGLGFCVKCGQMTSGQLRDRAVCPNCLVLFSKICIENIPLSQLIPYAKNSRTHSDDQVAQLAASIREFGFTNPVLISSDNDIIAGHGRVKAAAKLGLVEVPCIRLGHLSVSQRRAYVIADNRLALNAGWDSSMLTLELLDLKAEEFDLGLLGFNEDELDALLNPDVPPAEGLTDPDAVPEVTETRCKPGDLWQLGAHRLLCGDSTNVQHVERLMGGEKADMVFTDPPYGIGIDGQKQSSAANPKHNRKGHEFRGWDDERPDPGVFDFIIALNIPAVIFGGNYFADLLPASRGWLYWGKGQDGALRSSDGELAWTNLSKPLRAVTVNRAALQGSVHPTQKPSEVVEFCLAYVGKANRVLDLFLGSGSTLIACEKTGRRCFGMEIDPQYCDVILARWEQFTGKSAVLEAANG